MNNKSRIIVVDEGVITSRSINGWGAIELKKIQGQLPSSTFNPPVSYTWFSTVLGSLKRIGVTKDDTIIIARDKTNSWRKFFYPCLDEETEVLTNRGWLYLKDVVEDKIDCKIATLNDKTQKVTYQKPIKYIKNWYEGDMYKFGGKKCSVDILMTPDHKHYTKAPEQNSFYLREAKDIRYSLTNHSKIFNWTKKEKKYFILPKYQSKTTHWRFGGKHTYIVEIPKRKIPMNDWIKFLGIYLSEGSLKGRRSSGSLKKVTNTKSKNVNYYINIPQSHVVNPDKCKKIEQLLKKLNIKFSISKNGKMSNYCFGNVQIAQYLQQLGKSHDKFIPREFLNSLSKRQCQLLLQYLIMGDGTKRGNNSYSYTTVSKQLANDIQELGIKAGWSTSVCWNNHKGQNIHFISFHKEFTPKTWKRPIHNWKGNVYCLEVPNHIFFIRRNGKTCWTGNCYKAQRWEQRDGQKHIDWRAQYKVIDKLLEQIQEGINWHVVWLPNLWLGSDFAYKYCDSNLIDEENIDTECYGKWYGLEADDIIAGASKFYSDREVIFVSIDADLDQLCIRENTKYFNLMIKYKGGRGIYKKVDNGYKVLAKKIEKGDKSDNILPGVTDDNSPKAIKIREFIIDLINLPDFVEEKLFPVFENLPKKEINYDKLPFPKSLAKKFNDIYKKDKIITFEDSMIYYEKKKKKTAKKAKEKRELKKKQTMIGE